MLPGINQWAFPANVSAIECISTAKRFGFESFEVCVGDEGPTSLDISEKDAAAIRGHAEKEGIALCSLASGMGWKYKMTSADPAERNKAKEVNARALQIAHWLGCDALLVVPGMCDLGAPYDVALENAIACVQDLAPTAERLKVSLAIENVWNKFLLSPVEIRDFIDQFDSEYVGAYFDTGNIVLYGYPEQWIEILGQRIRAVHLTDYRASVGTLDGFVMLMEGDVNWPAVMKALRGIDYNRALTAEYFGYKHGLEPMLDHIRAAQRSMLAL